jgi:two-component system sensor histidine kinase BarA
MLSKFYPRLSIRAQILIVAIAPTLIVTLILVVLAYQDNVAQGQQTLHRQGTLLAAQLAANLEYPLFTGATEQLPTLIQAMVKPAATVLGTEVIRVTVLGKDQRIVYADPNAAVPAPAPLDGDPLLAPNAFPTDRQRFVAPIYLEPLVLPAPAPQEKRYLGAVELELATAPVQIEQTQHFLRNIGLVAITFVAGLILACWTGYRLARSLRQTARAIERIKGGDLFVRLPRTEVNEIGILQDGVNLLAETIAGEQTRLENELAKVRGEYDLVLARLQIQTQTAEQANQAKSLFLAKVSHEMRTPLYSIQGLAEQLLRAVSNPEEERTVQTLLGAVRTLYNTISDILDFTQLERGKYTPHFELLDLWTEIEQVIETIAPLAARQRLYLDVIVEPRTPTTVWSDSRALRAIVTNLIANAVKFTERGGICIRLSASFGPTDGSVLVDLRVQDTGCAAFPPTRWPPFSRRSNKWTALSIGASAVPGWDCRSSRVTATFSTATLVSKAVWGKARPLR